MSIVNLCHLVGALTLTLTCAILVGEVPSLKHEALDHTVEGAALVVQRHACRGEDDESQHKSTQTQVYSGSHGATSAECATT